MASLSDILSEPIPACESVPFLATLLQQSNKLASAEHDAYIASHMPEVMARHSAAVAAANGGTLGAPPAEWPHVQGWDPKGVSFRDEFTLPPTAKLAAAYRRLVKLSEESMPQDGGAAAMASQTAGRPLMPTNYLEAERMGQALESQQTAEYYRGQAQQAAQSAQAAQEQVSQVQQQLDALQQQAQDSQMMVEQSQQQAMAATDAGLKKSQEAANMRIATQQLRAHLMDLASQDPAASTSQSMQGGDAGQPSPTAPDGVGGESPTNPAPNGAAQIQVPQPGDGQGGVGPEPGGPSQPGSEKATEPASAAKLGSAKLGSAAPTPFGTFKRVLYGETLKPVVDFAKKDPAGALGAAIGAVAGGVIGATRTREEADAYDRKVREIEQRQAAGENTFHTAVERYYMAARSAQARLSADNRLAGTLSGAAAGASAGMGLVGSGKYLLGAHGRIKQHVNNIKNDGYALGAVMQRAAKR